VGVAVGYIHGGTIFDSHVDRWTKGCAHRLVRKESIAAMTIQWIRKIRAALTMSLLLSHVFAFKDVLRMFQTAAPENLLVPDLVVI